jgi:glycosyltransferase involved in cell wall biosynthesis
VDWLRQEKINLVHSHTYHAHTYAIPAARRLGLPVLLHHHKTLEKMKWHRWWTMRGLTRRATRVLALSEKTAADLRRSFSLSSDKVTALPNAVNETEFHPLPREQKLSLRAGLDLDSGAFIFLTVASLQEVKNHPLLLAAAEAAAPELSNCGFYCLGDGPERPILLERASLLPHHTTFHFPGAMRPVAPWLQCADAFVLPSVWEGQSLALLQAIRCGLPVLASRIEGNTSLLGSSHPGLFSPVDPTELARLLTKLRLDAGFQKELLAAQSRLPLPSWTELASQIENIYRGEFSRFF